MDRGVQMSSLTYSRCLIILGITIKVILGISFSSGFSDELFVPFVKLFNDIGFKAWSVFDGGFPYSSFMVLVLSPVVSLMEFVDSIMLKNLIFKLPLFFFDFLILRYLYLLRPQEFKISILLYFLSPVLLFSTFIHSQLDIIPTAIAFASFFYLVNSREKKAILFLGLSVAFKFNFLILAPLFAFYLYRKNTVRNIKSALNLLCLFLLPVILSFLPLYISGVSLKVNEVSLLFETYFEVLDLKIFIFPVVLTFIYFNIFRMGKISIGILTSLISIILLAFVVTVYPNPGWMLWPLPFFTYGINLTKEKRRTISLLYSFLCALYLIFFVFCYTHPLNSFSVINVFGDTLSLVDTSSSIKNLVFTSFILCLVCCIYIIYDSAIIKSLHYKRLYQSFLVGIAGDSGAGKTTLLKAIVDIIGDNKTTTLEGDGDHKWERGDENWNTFTHLNPRANNLNFQMYTLMQLKKGNSVIRSDYDHTNGVFKKGVSYTSNDFIIIAGLHSFYLKKAREVIDLKIYLDTEEDLRYYWKSHRDANERDKSFEETNELRKRREPDAQKYIHSQMKYSDLIIRYISDQKRYDDNNVFTVEYLVDIDIDMAPFVDLLPKSTVSLLDYDFNVQLTLQRLRLEIMPDFNLKRFEPLLNDIVDMLEINPIFTKTGVDAFNQLIVLLSINNKYTGDVND